MLQWLLEQDFMPHGHCYFWRPDILWTHVISDAVVALAYYSIPITLVYFASKRKDIPFREVLGLFAAFIILCGTTHIMGIVTVWKPLYVIDGMIKAATALVSIVTAAVLIPLVPVALSMRSPAELEAANLLLREEVERRRTAERRLEAAVENLYRSNEELEQFASAASHDLQSPLRAVVNFTQMLRESCAGRLTSEDQEFMSYIEDGGKRMQSLITDLLQISRIGKQEAAPEPVSMDKALEQAKRQLQANIAEKGAVVEVAGPLPEVMGNVAQLTQLMQNLIGNAIKYTSAETRPHIRVSAAREENLWHFVVADNGIGIPEKHLRAVFVIFRRLHTEDEFPGTGIGLSLCKKIVEHHGGSIWAESDVGQGSRFHFTLPAVQSTTPPDR